MEWLDRIAQSFIMTFGITQPTPERRKMANRVIGMLLLSVVAAMVAVFAVGVWSLFH